MGLAAKQTKRSNIVNIADRRKLAYVSAPGEKRRDSDSWYTPKRYIDAARDVLDGIELDPFSSVFANNLVRADRFFDVEHSAFAQDWRSPDGSPVSVWMNPPYSSGLINRAISHFVQQYKNGDIKSAIVLTNNSTETKWFAELRSQCSAICFTNHRISFESHDGKNMSTNTRGQVFFYFSNKELDETPRKREQKFVARFSEFGWCASKTLGW